ncbi:MAG: phosphoribosylglycinamide formyltransferase [Oscillospiraceae bacterium]
MLKIAVLVSGGGTNLQAIIDAKKNGGIDKGELALVLASRADAFALERARSAGIKTAVVSRKSFLSSDEYSDAVLKTLKDNRIDIVVLAGFLSILGKNVIQAYPKRIINVHPSLIPSFCGDGYYGLTVHEKALEKGVKITGATVHFVNEIADDGEIILQKAVNVEPDDTPETLQRRVMEQAEWELLPKALNMLCEEYSN